jgi:hypothetical protein
MPIAQIVWNRATQSCRQNASVIEACDLQSCGDEVFCGV